MYLLCLQWVALMGGYALMELTPLSFLLNPKGFYGEKNVFIHPNSLFYVHKNSPKYCHGELVNIGCIRPVWSNRFNQLIEIVCFISWNGDCFVTYLVLHHSNSAMTGTRLTEISSNFYKLFLIFEGSYPHTYAHSRYLICI